MAMPLGLRKFTRPGVVMLGASGSRSMSGTLVPSCGGASGLVAVVGVVVVVVVVVVDLN